MRISDWSSDVCSSDLRSTRGGMAPRPFSDILLEGLAPDGGLTVPEALPQISRDTLDAWRSLAYPDLAAEILGLFIDDIAAADLRRLTAAAYKPESFGGSDNAPLKPLEIGRGSGRERVCT